MLTKHPRSNSFTPRAPELTGRLAHALKSSAQLWRASASVALSLALFAQTLVAGTAHAAAAQQQSQPAFDVDAEATAAVVRLPAQPVAATSASLSALSSGSGAGGGASAAASMRGETHFVEPPPAPPEPLGAEARAAVKRSARRGKIRDESKLAATAATGKSFVASSSTQPDIITVEPPPDFLAQSDPGSVAPPDVNGAVGREHVLSSTRAGYVVHDKVTAAVISSVPIEVFWAATGATNLYNPRSLYDPYNDRWLLSAISDPRTAASSVLVAVSQTSDPAGAYHLYRFDADFNDGLWADYGSLGFNKNWLVVSFNAHNIFGDAFAEGRVLALDYPAARAGTAAATLFAGFTISGSFSMQPAVTYSTTEEFEYFVSHVGSGSATYRASAIVPTPDGPVFFVGEQKVNGLGGWSQPGGEILPQAPPAGGGVARKIDSSDARVQKVVFRDGSIYYCQTVGLPAGRSAANVDRTAAQWTRLDSNADFADGGRVEDPNATPTNGGKWYAYPSLSVNRFGDVLVGMNEFSSAQHPSAAYATHVAGDPAGSVRGPVVYKAGEGYYEKVLGNRNLWGLYSGAQVDSVNDRDIWTIQEYAQPPAGTGPASGRWGAWWQRAALPNRVPAVAITSPAGGSTHLEGSTVQFTATTADAETHVTSVEFFNGPTKIGDATQTSPDTWSFAWQNVPAGSHPIRARATDSEGGAESSAPVTIVVRPVTTLSDDFNDNSTDTTKWDVFLQMNSAVVEQNGRLQITTPSNGVGYAGYFARDRLNLTNRRATVEVVQAARDHGMDTNFVLQDMTTERHSYLFSVGGNPGNMLMRETVNGAVASQIVIPYDPAQHRFWRFRHDPAADAVVWETSADGVGWAARHSVQRHFDIDNMQARLAAGRHTNTGSPAQTAVFDNYRVENNPPSRTTFADNFNDNSTDLSKWAINASPGVTVAERNQRLEVTPPASATGYGGYYSLSGHDLTEARATVELVQSTQQHYGIETYFMLADAAGSGNYLLFATGGGNFLCQSMANGAMTRVVLSYDPAQHRHLRFQHYWEDDTVAWETSADGVTWTTRRRIPRPFNITSLRVQLLAGKYTATTPTSTAVFDNIRIERPHPALQPSDNFNDNSLDPARWQLLHPGAPVQVSEQNQRLEIALAPNTASYNGVKAVPSVDFHNKTVQVEVLQTVSFAGWAEQAFMLRRDDNNAFYFDVGGQGTFVCDAKVNGVLDRTLVWYDHVQYRFWRLRHNGAANTMNFEVSPDGRAWTTLKSVAVGFPLDSMQVWLYAGAWGTGNSAPGTAIYDGLKLTPNE